MKILVSGASGLIGSALVPLLQAQGCEIVRLVRTPQTTPDAIYWNPATAEFADNALDGIDAVVHLAGENIASGRWTAARKARIKDSRVVGTRLLANAMATAANPPQHWICASAIGYYGNRGDEPLTENSSAGDGFLARLCVEWEAAAAPAVAAGIRVAFPRIGIVLSNRGGALAKMLLPFKLCLGGHLGNGRQYMSWISLHDLARALQFLLVTESISGPVNLSAPNPTTNREFTKAMGRALGRPTPFPAPAAILRLLLGEMAEQLLLNSARAIPGTLVDNGFQFDHETLDEALAATLAPH